MEDSISTIIYIVVFVIIAIVNIAAGNKKRALEREKKLKQLEKQKNISGKPQPVMVNPNRKEEKPKSLEDFLKNVLGQENAQKESAKPSYESLEKIETPYYESFEAASEIPVTKSETKNLTKEKELIPSSAYAIKDENSETYSDQLIYKIRKGEFDVKEAVLYSEILNKKF